MSGWKVIDHREVPSGGLSSIEFTSISGTYTDLMIVASLRSTQASTVEQVRLSINGSTANFTKRFVQGSGSASNSYSGTDSQMGYTSAANDTANTFGNLKIYIPNYAGSTNKSIYADTVDENSGTEAFQVIMASLWSQAAPITSLALSTQNGLLAQYSSATLYGITKGSSGGVTVS